MILESQKDTELGFRQYHCPHCGYTWIELIGNLVTKKSGATDVHIRLGGDGSPECSECGCCYAHETAITGESLDVYACLHDVISVLKKQMAILDKAPF